jgi:y4mF family transcriptional regulator
MGGERRPWHPIRVHGDGEDAMSLGNEIKELRKRARLSQMELAERAGVGLRFVRELERGKETVRLDKVNQVLRLLSREVGVVKHERTEG